MADQDDTLQAASEEQDKAFKAQAASRWLRAESGSANNMPSSAQSGLYPIGMGGKGMDFTKPPQAPEKISVTEREVRQRAIEAFNAPMDFGLISVMPVGQFGTFSLPTQIIRQMARARLASGTKPAGRMKYFSRVMEAWGFSAAEAARILGFQDASVTVELFSGRVAVPAGDHAERLKLMLTIAVELENLYEEDGTIKVWLNQSRAELGNKTPRELLSGGTFEGLIKVRQLLRYEAQG